MPNPSPSPSRGVPDILKTPAPPGPVPIPYPNQGTPNDFKTEKALKAVKEHGTPSQSGDEAGTFKGIVSSQNLKEHGKLQTNKVVFKGGK